jgi:putative ABC transport system permease protein
VRNDLRDACRALLRAPAFSIVAVVTLALAIGSATALFSIVDAVFVRGLPYANPSRLQTVYESSDNATFRVPSYPTFKDWQTQSASVRDAIEGFAFVRGDGVLIPGTDGPAREIDAYVTPGFFDLLGTHPILGRTFRPDEEQLGGTQVAVLSFDYFMHHFGGDRAILGKTVSVDSVPTTIVGVMPRGFAFPNFGSGGWLPPALWQPIAVFQATHAALSLRGLHVDSRAVLRLRAGTDSARAAAAMRTIAARLAEAYPAEQAHWTSVVLRSLSDEMFGQLRSTMLLIAGAVAFVLLLACANVANLLLVRNSVRARELAVRAALGAGSWRLARHLLAEAAVIAAAAGIAGVGLAMALVSFVRPYAAQRLPFATYFAVDARAAFFTIGISAATALLIGILPVFHADRGSLAARLRGGMSVDARGAGERRVRDALVSIQFALAITVLIGAGLLIQSVRRVSSVPLGFDPDGVVSFAIAPPAHKYDSPAQAAALYKRILEAVRAVPGVEGVAAAGGALLPTRVETDDQRGATVPPTALYHPVSTDFLKVLRTSIVAGRGFSDEDMRSPAGLMVTENLAKQLWPSGSAIGQRITVFRASQARADFGQPITLPVVGVVADYHQQGPEATPPTQVFLPYTLEVWPWMNFVVRASRAAAIIPSITQAVHDVEPAIVFMAKPSAQRTGPSLSDPRLIVASLMAGFASTALLLAAIGLYGIVAYGVAQRTRELGIRIAVGATDRNILTLVLGQAARLVVVGVGCGLLVALAATKVLQAMLFETSTTDWATFVVVPIVLAIVATVASVVPAYRATRTDPIIVIKAE